MSHEFKQHIPSSAFAIFCGELKVWVNLNKLLFNKAVPFSGTAFFYALMLSIAIQKKGRLSEESLNLLKSAGYTFPAAGGKLRALSNNGLLEVFFLRDDDIPEYVANGVCDLGVVGENVLFEKKQDVEVKRSLGFGKCRLSIASRPNEPLKSIEDLEGKKVATSYPVLLQKYLDEKGINAELHFINGSVEIAPSMGLSEAVFDIVSTGTTLKLNGLIERFSVLKSQAVLVGSKSLSASKLRELDELLFRIDAVQQGRKNKYIMLNAPNNKLPQISALLPGMNSPTVTPLLQDGWSSLQSVISEDTFWEIIQDLKNAGAEGILVLPIEKMML